MSAPLRHTVPAGVSDVRLVDHARRHLAVVATRELGPLIARGALRLAGEPARIAQPVRAGDELTLDPSELDDLRSRRLVTEPADLGLDVAYEDDDLVVVDKPSGLHVHPMGRYRDDTVLGGVLWLAGARADDPWAAWRPHPVHRLDRATSGLLVFAKSRGIHDAFQALLADGRVARTYHALVEGDVRDDQGRIEAPLGRDPDRGYRRAVVPLASGGQEAVTHWRVVDRLGDRTLLEVRLETGRTHQIRVHLATLGHPIVGDSLYAASAAESAESAVRICLRAVEVGFPHPRTGALVALRRTGSVRSDDRAVRPS